MACHWNAENVAVYLSEPRRLPAPKKCNTCLRVHTETTPNAIFCKRGDLYFQCSCESTLLVRQPYQTEVQLPSWPKRA